MSEKKQKRQRNTSRTIILSLLMIVIAGTTVVFAWFSLTNQAQVSSLSIKAGTSGGLLIGSKANDVVYDSVDLKTIDAKGESFCVKPITTNNGSDFYLPVYGESGYVEGVSNTVADLDKISNKTEGNGGYMLSYTVYLLAESKNNIGKVGIRLASEEADIDHDGTFVRAKDTKKSGAHAAMRMSFSANGTTTVYEPNDNVNVTGASDTQYKVGNWSNLATLKQTSDKNGLFSKTALKPGNKAVYDSKTSAELFEIDVNKVTPVTINIWLEGADKDCVNEIMANDMVCNIQFICLDLD